MLQNYTRGAARNVYLGLTSAKMLLFGVSHAGMSPNPLALHALQDRNPPQAAPSGLALAAGSTSIAVSWDAPAGDIQGYDVAYRTGNAGWIAWPHSGTDTSATITGLTSGTRYEVRVRWRNSYGSSPWTSPVAATPQVTRATTAPVIFATRAVFEGAFTGEQIGSQGRWGYLGSGSTGSGGTGPGSNNSLPFVFTETSGSSASTPAQLALMQDRGRVAFASLPSGTSRVLHMRLCIQGDFGNGQEGLSIEQRVGAGEWTQLDFIRGWDYSNSYTTGQTLTDEGGVQRTVVANGGWVDFTVNVPDNVTELRLQPTYIVPPGTQVFTHDIAFRQFHWAYIQ